jgi:hypothetical protein
MVGVLTNILVPSLVRGLPEPSAMQVQAKKKALRLQGLIRSG